MALFVQTPFTQILQAQSASSLRGLSAPPSEGPRVAQAASEARQTFGAAVFAGTCAFAVGLAGRQEWRGRSRQQSGSLKRATRTALQVGNPKAVFETSMGSFTAELYFNQLPITVSNFVDLAKTGFYDGVHFHRVIPNFMCQFGCPNAKDPQSPRAGTGGPADGSKFQLLGGGKTVTRVNGGNIPDELTAKLSNEPGTLSMANTGRPNTGGSQFFINTAHNKFLDWFDRSTQSAHPVFGKVIDNYDLVQKISQVRTQNDSPVTPVMMKTITIIE